MGIKNLFKKRDLEIELETGEEIIYSSFYEDAVKRLKKNKFAMISMYVLIALVLMAIFAPLIAPYDPAEQDVYNIMQKPSSEHIFGTDEFGRDILSRIIYGARISLSVGIIAEAIAITIGVILGSIAGYFGGKADMIISRLIEIFASFPQILFALAIMFVLGPGIINLFIAIGFVGWTSVARVIRGQIMQLKEKEYVEASIASGGGGMRIIFKHLIPNCLSTIIVIVTLNIPADIMYEASLSFLGLGVQPPTASWGAMINAARAYIRANPHYSIFPGIAIMITVLAFNMLGDGLRDALDPKLKNQGGGN
ncbi:ABC transporter permease [Maledivibacter halophilus]|uniref:Peptide/nickel transport system permease protein n=1 Tax=Maledivibacter halophilus TaxID=36842 RepID=A0A1T5ME29_9FIRM|nr:ABC transporter permease [Maledivibacter halophilus]SKC86158.1 peptide/nickel transport system permease protein [Maledivibacter halophilus]